MDTEVDSSTVNKAVKSGRRGDNTLSSLKGRCEAKGEGCCFICLMEDDITYLSAAGNESV